MYIQVSDKLLQFVRAPDELNYGEIILLSHIVSLNKGENKCFMSNKALADLLNTTERTIKRWIAHLKERDLVKTYYEYNGSKERRVMVPNLSRVKGQK